MTNEEIVNYISDKCHLDPVAVSSRLRILNEMFKLTEDDCLKLSDTHAHLFRSYVYSLVEAKNSLSSEPFNFSNESINAFIKQFSSFPYIDKALPYIEEKLAVLNSLGIENNQIARSFDILRKDKDELALRAKLAFINRLPIESFTYDGHYVNSEIIWSRMKALEKGICSCDRIYSNYHFLKNEKFDIETLVNMFPLDQSALNEIESRYNAAIKQGLKWKSSFRAFVRYQTDPSSSFEPNQDMLNKQKSILAKASVFASNEFLRSQGYLTKYETTLKLLDFFNMSLEEVNQILSENPNILHSDVSKFKGLKNALEKDFDLTKEELTNIFITKPSIVDKSISEYVAYKSFLHETLLLTKPQIKYILVNNPKVLTIDPQTVIENTKLIARSLKKPFNVVACGLLYNSEVFTLPQEQIETNIRLYNEMGISDSQIAYSQECLLVNPEELKTKLMLSRIYQEDDKEFLRKNFLYDVQTVYARVMFNLEHNQELPVYRNDKQYFKAYKIALGKDVDFDETQLTKALICKYPLTNESVKELEKYYYSAFANQPEPNC